MGAHRNSRSTETNLWKNAAPPLAWMVDGIGAGYASVSVVGPFVFTTGNSAEAQTVSCRKVLDGSQVWVQKITSKVPKHSYEGSRSTPTIDGDRVYVVSSDGSICCLAASDGRILWSKKFSQWEGKMMSNWGYSESPLVDGNLVLCTPGGAKAMLVALDKNSGDEVWRCESNQQVVSKNPKTSRDIQDGAAYSSIVISQAAGIRQYIQLVGKGLISVRAGDGKLLWEYAGVANGTANIPTPIVHGDYVFTSTGYDTGSALLKISPTAEGCTPNELYFLDGRTLQNKQGGMVLVGDHIYCGHGNGNGLLTCVEMSTGKIAWTPRRGSGRGEVSMVYADGHLLMRFDDGTLSLVKADPTQYEEAFTFQPAFQDKKSWAYPVIANGKLYLREQDKLMAYQLR